MPNMPRNRRPLRKTFLREWRKFRGLTQEQAAERVDMDRSNLSRVERGEIPYSQELLEAAAFAYQCEPWDILHVNPLKEREVVDMMQLIERKDSDLVRRVIDALPDKSAPTGTNDN